MKEQSGEEDPNPTEQITSVVPNTQGHFYITPINFVEKTEYLGKLYKDDLKQVFAQFNQKA